MNPGHRQIFTETAGLGDLLAGAGAERLGLDRQFLRQLAVTEDLDAIEQLLQQSLLDQRGRCDRRAIIERGLEIAS